MRQNVIKNCWKQILGWEGIPDDRANTIVEELSQCDPFLDSNKKLRSNYARKRFS